MLIDTPATQARVQYLICKVLQLKPSEVTPQSTINDLGADSIDRLEILMVVELEFNISIPDHIAEKFRTPQDITDYLQSLPTA